MELPNNNHEPTSDDPEALRPRYKIETLWAFEVDRAITHEDVSLIEMVMGIKLRHFNQPDSFVVGSKSLASDSQDPDSEPMFIVVQRRLDENYNLLDGISIELRTTQHNHEGKARLVDDIEKEKDIVRDLATLLGGSEVEPAV